jgi:5-methylcytosine-specific restriction endonuclease McrA
VRRLCIEPRCPNDARPGKSQCEFHGKQYERERSRRRRAKARDAQGRSVYRTKLWLMRRKQAFERDPRCAWVEDGVRCERIGEELDHIVPLDADGDAYSAKNLQLLCAEHHRLKTGLENRERLSR